MDSETKALLAGLDAVSTALEKPKEKTDSIFKPKEQPRSVPGFRPIPLGCQGNCPPYSTCPFCSRL